MMARIVATSNEGHLLTNFANLQIGLSLEKKNLIVLAERLIFFSLLVLFQCKKKFICSHPSFSSLSKPTNFAALTYEWAHSEVLLEVLLSFFTQQMLKIYRGEDKGHPSGWGFELCEAQGKGLIVHRSIQIVFDQIPFCLIAPNLLVSLFVIDSADVHEFDMPFWMASQLDGCIWKADALKFSLFSAGLCVFCPGAFLHLCSLAYSWYNLRNIRLYCSLWVSSLHLS